MHVLSQCKPSGASKWHFSNEGRKPNRVEFKKFLLLKTVRVCNTILTLLITLKAQLFEGSFSSFSSCSAAMLCPFKVSCIYLLYSSEFVIPFERIEGYDYSALGGEK